MPGFEQERVTFPVGSVIRSGQSTYVVVGPSQLRGVESDGTRYEYNLHISHPILQASNTSTEDITEVFCPAKKRKLLSRDDGLQVVDYSRIVF